MNIQTAIDNVTTPMNVTYLGENERSGDVIHPHVMGLSNRFEYSAVYGCTNRTLYNNIFLKLKIINQQKIKKKKNPMNEDEIKHLHRFNGIMLNTIQIRHD